MHTPRLRSVTSHSRPIVCRILTVFTAVKSNLGHIFYPSSSVFNQLSCCDSLLTVGKFV